MARITIPAPVIDRLTVTRDDFGGGVNDDGVPYETFTIARLRNNGTAAMLADITIYAADGIPALVWDRMTDYSAANIRAAQRVRDYIAANHPDARANSYRFTVA